MGCSKSLAHVLFKRTESLALCAVFRVLQVGLIKGIFFVFAKGLRAQRAGRVAPRRGSAKRRAAALGAAQRRAAQSAAAGG